MAFKDKYTTDLFISNEKAVLAVQDPKNPILDFVTTEQDKTVLSSDAYALGEMLQEVSSRLELLNNRLVR